MRNAFWRLTSAELYRLRGKLWTAEQAMYFAGREDIADEFNAIREETF